MNLLRFRTKMWFGLWGFYSWATVFLALVHSSKFIFTLLLAIGAWYYAEFLERQDLKDLGDSNEQ